MGRLSAPWTIFAMEQPAGEGKLRTRHLARKLQRQDPRLSQAREPGGVGTALKEPRWQVSVAEMPYEKHRLLSQLCLWGGPSVTAIAWLTSSYENYCDE